MSEEPDESTESVVKLVCGNHLFICGDIEQETFHDLRVLVLGFMTSRIKPDVVFVHISSDGGNSAYGLAIYDLLRILNQHVNMVTIVEGCAFSAASLFGLAADPDNRYMFPNSTIMIHQPWMSSGDGTLAEHKVDLESLNRLNQRYAKIYKTRTKMSKAAISKNLLNDHEFDLKQCIATGFVCGEYSARSVQ